MAAGFLYQPIILEAGVAYSLPADGLRVYYEDGVAPISVQAGDDFADLNVGQGIKSGKRFDRVIINSTTSQTIKLYVSDLGLIDNRINFASSSIEASVGNDTKNGLVKTLIGGLDRPESIVVDDPSSVGFLNDSGRDLYITKLLVSGAFHRSGAVLFTEFLVRYVAGFVDQVGELQLHDKSNVILGDRYGHFLTNSLVNTPIITLGQFPLGASVVELFSPSEPILLKKGDGIQVLNLGGGHVSMLVEAKLSATEPVFSIPFQVEQWRIASQIEDGNGAGSEPTGLVDTEGLGLEFGVAGGVDYEPYSNLMSVHYNTNIADFIDNDVHVNAGGFIENMHSTVRDLQILPAGYKMGGANDNYKLLVFTLADIKSVDSFGNDAKQSGNAGYQLQTGGSAGWGNRMGFHIKDSLGVADGLFWYLTATNELRFISTVQAQFVADEIFDAAVIPAGNDNNFLLNGLSPVCDPSNSGIDLDASVGQDCFVALLVHPFDVAAGEYRIDVITPYQNKIAHMTRIPAHANNAAGVSLEVSSIQAANTQFYSHSIVDLGANFEAANFYKVAEEFAQKSYGNSKSLPTEILV